MKERSALGHATEGALRLNVKLAKWAAAAVLSIGVAAPALGGSVTRPVGAALG